MLVYFVLDKTTVPLIIEYKLAPLSQYDIKYIDILTYYFLKIPYSTKLKIQANYTKFLFDIILSLIYYLSYYF
jgi:hypothetical protein